MDQPKVAGTSPMMVDLEAGKKYAWCACGASENQPWCNGAHKTTSITPLVFECETTRKGAMCMCKQTSNPPYCDGSHKNLAG